MHNLYRRRKLSEKPTQKRTNPWPEYTQKLNLQVALTKVKCLKCQFLNIITVAKLLFITTPTFNTPRFLKKLNPLFSLRSRRLEVVGTRKNGGARRRHPSRVSLARARSLFHPLLPSACYAGCPLFVLYSWTSPQRPPWGQKKVAVVERFKQASMYGRCGEVEVRLYISQVTCRNRRTL